MFNWDTTKSGLCTLDWTMDWIMDWLCTEEFVRVERKSRSDMVVGHSWDPKPIRIASSLGRLSEKRRWLCSYTSLPEPGYHVLH